MIAAFLVLRLRSVLGRHRDSNRTDNSFGLDGERASSDPNIITLEEQKAAQEKSEASEEIVTDKPDVPDALDLGLRQIRGASLEFDKNEFLLGVRTAFEFIVEAFASGNRDKLKALLSNEVYANFSSAIARRESNEETLESTLIRIVDVVYLEAELVEDRSLITVKITSEQTNVTRDKEGEIIDGSSDQVREIVDIWTFSRETASRDPNWVLVATRSID